MQNPMTNDGEKKKKNRVLTGCRGAEFPSLGPQLRRAGEIRAQMCEEEVDLECKSNNNHHY